MYTLHQAFDEALAVLAPVLATRRRTLGGLHDDTLQSMVCLHQAMEQQAALGIQILTIQRALGETERL